MARYSRRSSSPARGRDPFWLEARYPGMCSACNRTVRAGERAFYYPNSKSLFCEASGCGGMASADFEAARFDDAQVGAY